MDVDGIDAAKGPSDWLGYWRPWCVKKGKECVMVGWSCREAGDRYRRVASGVMRRSRVLPLSCVGKLTWLTRLKSDRRERN